MDDTAYREFFEQPMQTYQRRYEALRAVFVDGRSQKKVAQVFGFSYDSMRQLVREFRQSCDAEGQSDESPFFEMSTSDAALRMTTKSANRPLPIGANSCSRPVNRCGSEPERQGCFYSCLC